MLQTWLPVLVYIVVFFAFVAGVFIWRRRSRKDRLPFPENAMLLRGPGETLRRKMAGLDERSFYEFLFAFIVPLGVAAAILWIATHLAGTWQLVAVGAALLGLFLSLYLVAQKLLQSVERWRNTYLGYFGERVVAEFLEPLKSQGCRVFHDVPCGEGKTSFNIDHVVAGPGGVFAIETKTRRKGRSREGFAAHEIIYDGQVLAFPWGEDRHGLDQAARQAEWLEDWLAQLLGRRTAVQPILTFPGWMIIKRGRGKIAVLNPKQIPAAIATRSQQMLEERELDLIVRQLEARCRDVEF